MSKVVRTVARMALTIAGSAIGFAIGGPLGATIGGMLGSMAGAVVLPIKVKQQQRQAAVTSLSLGEVPREAILGKAMTGGSLVDAFNFGGKYGTDWEVQIIAVADHECDSLVQFYVNDKLVNFVSDGPVAGYNGQLEIYWRKGTEAQTLPSIVTTNGPGWNANDNGAGIAYVVAAYKADAADAKNPIWPGGRPSFAWVVKGAKCYNARKDSTVPGGSGAHRRDNPTTWEWSENLIDCRYAWVRGIYACNRVAQPGQLLVGRGLSAIEAPPERTFAPANLCDEIVAGERRYLVGGVIPADDDYLTSEAFFAGSCGGVITQPEGSVEIEPGHAKSPVVYITDDDLLVGSTVDYSGYLSEADDEWVNTIIPRYVEPAQRWADHAAPIRRNNDDVIADGGPREQTLSLPLVSRATQAGRVGEMARRTGRLWKRAAITLGPRFCELEEGDWIVWTSPRHLKGASVPFRVMAYNLDEKWHNSLQLSEINATVYSDGAFIADSAAALGQDAPPAIGAPGISAWALSASQLTSGGQTVPALVITGAVDDVYAQAVRFEYWPDDGVTDPVDVTGWIGATMVSPGVVRREITSIAPGAVYYVAVTYVVAGVPGDRRILGPVTAGEIGGIAAGYAGYLTNESHTIAADSAGTVSSFAGAGGAFKVFAGVIDVTAISTFSVVGTPTGVTIAINSAGVYAPTAMSADTGFATLRASYAGTDIDKVYSISKSRAGPGGGAGAAAKLLTIISDRQTIAYDPAGAPSPTTQTTTFTANKQNSTATVTWSVTDAAGVARTPVTTYLSAATGNAVTMTESQFAAARNGTSGVIVTGTMTDGSTFTDKISVVRVQAGAPGTNGTNGTNGANGLNNAIVRLYQRKSTSTPPAIPTGTTTYTFATSVLSGTLGSWTQGDPGSSAGKYLFGISAPASSNTATDTIATGEWSSAALLQQDGEDGRDAVVFWQDSTPASPVLDDTWVTKTAPKIWRRWDGTVWVPLLGTIAQFDALNASYIVAGTIVASKFLLDTGVDLAAIVPGALNSAVSATLGSAVNMPITLNSPNNGGPNGDGTYVIVTTPALAVTNSADAIFISVSVTVTAGTARGFISLEKSTNGSSWTTVQEISSTSSSGVSATTFTLSLEDLSHSPGSLYFRILASQGAAQSLGDGPAGTNFTISAATIAIRRFFVK